MYKLLCDRKDRYKEGKLRKWYKAWFLKNKWGEEKEKEFSKFKYLRLKVRRWWKMFFEINFTFEKIPSERRRTDSWLKIPINHFPSNFPLPFQKSTNKRENKKKFILRTKFRKKEKIPKEKKYPDEANSTPMKQHVRGYTFRSPSHESLSKLYIRESGDEWTGTGSESYAMINGRPLGSASLAHLGPWGPSRGKRCTRVEANARWVLLRTASQHPSWIDRSNNRFWESGREFCPRYFLILPSTSDRRKRKILCS